MKLPILALTTILITNSSAFALDGRGAFGDGSPPNTYIAGQPRPTLTYQHKNLSENYYGKNAVRDGSSPNTYIAGQPRPTLTYQHKNLSGQCL